jgi:hypothetical protein
MSHRVSEAAGAEGPAEILASEKLRVYEDYRMKEAKRTRVCYQSD